MFRLWNWYFYGFNGLWCKKDQDFKDDCFNSIFVSYSQHIQITFDHHWPTVILCVEDWHSSRQIDVIILNYFFFFLLPVCMFLYVSSIKMLYLFPRKKPWHSFAFVVVVSQSGYVKVKHVYCFCFWQLTASFLVVFAPHWAIYSF